MGTILGLLSCPFLFMPAIGMTLNFCLDDNKAQPDHSDIPRFTTQLPNQSYEIIQATPSTGNECEPGNGNDVLFYYVAFSGSWNLGWCITQISHLSLIPELTSDEQDRIGLTTIRNAATVLSNLSVYAIFLLMVKSGNFIQSIFQVP